MIWDYFLPFSKLPVHSDDYFLLLCWTWDKFLNLFLMFLSTFIFTFVACVTDKNSLLNTMLWNFSHIFFLFKSLKSLFNLLQSCFYFFFLTLFYFTILYWFCRTSTWICHGCTWVPNPETPPTSLGLISMSFQVNFVWAIQWMQFHSFAWGYAVFKHHLLKRLFSFSGLISLQNIIWWHMWGFISGPFCSFGSRVCLYAESTLFYCYSFIKCFDIRNLKPPTFLPPEKSVYRSRSNS